MHLVFGEHKQVVVIEEGVRQGGAASALMEWAQENNYLCPIHSIGISDHFISQGKTEIQLEDQGLNVEQVRNRLEQIASKKL